jgi:hypothetical protein
MSQSAPTAQVLPTAASAGGSRTARAQAAIADAAQRTGIDFGYLLAQARIESGLDPHARARTSSATGLFQFLDQTWLATMDRHGERLGFGQLAQAIDMSGGRARVTDPAMGLRLDPHASALMAGALAGDNAAALTQVLGREPDASELYLAHFLGAQGASRMLGALSSDPTISAASVLPGAARANRAIFYERSGTPRSVSEVMQVIRGRMAGAMEQGFDPAAITLAAANPAAPSAQASSTSGLPSLPSLPAAPAASSMADLIGNTFGLGGDGAAVPGQAHVRRAYARLAAMGV